MVQIHFNPLLPKKKKFISILREENPREKLGDAHGPMLDTTCSPMDQIMF